MFDSLSAKDSDRLQRVENWALRLILKADSCTHLRDMHTDLHLNYLVDRRHLHTAHQVFKGLNDLAPSTIKEHLTALSDLRTRNTRASKSKNLLIPNFRLKTTIAYDRIS